MRDIRILIGVIHTAEAKAVCLEEDCAKQPNTISSRRNFIEQVGDWIQGVHDKVVGAISEVPPVHIIPDREEQFRNINAGLRRLAFNRLLQIGAAAGEAESPLSEVPKHRQDFKLLRFNRHPLL